MVAGHLLNVETKEGIVTLSGAVNSLFDKERAVELTQMIKGVRSVIDRINVNPEKRPDDEISDVECKDGNVALSGVVGSFYERVRPHHKSRVAGVKTVNSDNLEIQWWARDKMKRYGKGRDLTNQKIAQALRLAFSQDPRIFSLNPDISVHKGGVKEGVAYLAGTADSHFERRMATQNALESGAKRVVNETTVDSNLFVFR